MRIIKKPNEREKLSSYIEYYTSLTETEAPSVVTPFWESAFIKFAQDNGVISYRNSRVICALLYKAELQKIGYINLATKLLKTERKLKVKNSTWSFGELLRNSNFTQPDPEYKQYPLPRNPAKTFEEWRKTMHELHEEHPELSEKLEAWEVLNKEVEEMKRENEVIYVWTVAKYNSGELVGLIKSYIKNRREKHSEPKKLLRKMLQRRDDPSEILPTFNPVEVDVIHSMLHKSQNMTQDEQDVLLKINPEGNRPLNPDFRIVISYAEALNMCYGEGTGSAERRKQFKEGIISLSEKDVRWRIDMDNGNCLWIQEPLIKKDKYMLEVDKEGVVKNKYFSLLFPRRILETMKNHYILSDKYERADLRSKPPKMTPAQDIFILKIKEVTPYTKGKREFKWEARGLEERVWGEHDRKHFGERLTLLLSFGKKMVELGFLKEFKRVDENDKTFFEFTFPEAKDMR